MNELLNNLTLATANTTGILLSSDEDPRYDLTEFDSDFSSDELPDDEYGFTEILMRKSARRKTVKGKARTKERRADMICDLWSTFIPKKREERKRDMLSKRPKSLALHNCLKMHRHNDWLAVYAEEREAEQRREDTEIRTMYIGPVDHYDLMDEPADDFDCCEVTLDVLENNTRPIVFEGREERLQTVKAFGHSEIKHLCELCGVECEDVTAEMLAILATPRMIEDVIYAACGRIDALG